jgi:hypothetical protein
MRHRNPKDRRCTYLVTIERSDDPRDLAQYLSSIQLEDCDVVIIDDSRPDVFDENRRVLRWVGRHVAPLPRHRSASGAIDLVRAGSALAACEKVIVAQSTVRYTPAELDELCSLLDSHEVVEPQEYFEPMPWWGSIDAARMLVHRAIEAHPDHGRTFGFRRSSLRGLRGLELDLIDDGEDAVRRLAMQGAEVHAASELFVRRTPPELEEWVEERPRLAGDDFALPVKSAFFFGLLPMALLLMVFGGLRLAGGYAGAIAFATVALAVRGRAGAAPFFPLRACLFAPVWVLERSVSVYWALFRKLRVTTTEPGTAPAAERANPRVASGE